MACAKSTLLTASSMNTFTSCQRRYYLAYELCLKETQTTDALRFGTAFHAALEARSAGRSEDEAIEAALATTTSDLLGEQTVVTLIALIRGYYRMWAGRDEVARMKAEVGFDYAINRVRGFRAAGKIDGLAVLNDGRLALVEHKTTSEDISPSSSYWERIRNNRQLYAYIEAAEMSGWTIDTVIYDVIRKPTIRQAQKENAYDFGARLLADCTETRPEFYFSRREVPVFIAFRHDFEDSRISIINQIRGLRRAGSRTAWPGSPWVPCHSQLVCRGCQFKGICMSGAKPTESNVPDGFRIGEAHEELLSQS